MHEKNTLHSLVGQLNVLSQSMAKSSAFSSSMPSQASNAVQSLSRPSEATRWRQPLSQQLGCARVCGETTERGAHARGQPGGWGVSMNETVETIKWKEGNKRRCETKGKETLPRDGGTTEGFDGCQPSLSSVSSICLGPKTELSKQPAATENLSPLGPPAPPAAAVIHPVHVMVVQAEGPCRGFQAHPPTCSDSGPVGGGRGGGVILGRSRGGSYSVGSGGVCILIDE